MNFNHLRASIAITLLFRQRKGEDTSPRIIPVAGDGERDVLLPVAHKDSGSGEAVARQGKRPK